MDVSCECRVLLGRGLCDELITRPEKYYRLWCVVVCDLETSWMRRPWSTGNCCAKNRNQIWTTMPVSKTFLTPQTPTATMNMNIVVPQVEIHLGHCKTRGRREAHIEIPAVSWPGTSSDMSREMTLHRSLPGNLCIHSNFLVPIFLTAFSPLFISLPSPSYRHYCFLHRFIPSLFLSFCSPTSITLK